MSSSRGKRLHQALTIRKIKKLYVLAIEVGVSESAISRWKKGGAISADHVVKLCKVLDISIDWFLLGRGNMDSHKKSVVYKDEHNAVEYLNELPEEASKLLMEFISTITQ
jgi:transcriptional regulator with XRE-family HTH domain